MGPHPIRVRDYEPVRDLAWADALLVRDFGGRLQARRGEMVDVLELPGLVAERDGVPAGLLTYRTDASGCEIAWIVASPRRAGTGAALLRALETRLRPGTPLWLVTTNDNQSAQGFFASRGFTVRAVRRGAVDESRRLLKPSIPTLGEHGVPIRDEVEMERSSPA